MPADDYLQVNQIGSGSDKLAADTVGELKYPRVKLVAGAAGETPVDVSAEQPFPTTAGITARTEVGNVELPVRVNSLGRLLTAIGDPLTAFGEVSVAQDTPLAQLDFIYGVNTEVCGTVVTGSGAISAATGLAVVSTTAATSSSAQLRSLRYVKYRPGQGAKARFTALFTAGVADSKQYAGIGTPDLQNGFFIGFNGIQFGICSIHSGVETWVAQADWNVDTCDGDSDAANPSGFQLDPTKGNVFQIKYQYLGFGAVFFFVENTNTGQFTLVHIRRHANLFTSTNIGQPSLHLLFQAVNTTNATEVMVKTASAALFLEGEKFLLGPRHGIDHTKSAITTRTNIVTLKNCTTFNGVVNAGQLQLRSVSFGSNTGGVTSGIITLAIAKNATLGGSPSFTPILGSTANNGVTIVGQSPTSYDTAGTTVTGGADLFSAVLNVGNGQLMDVTDLELFLNPGDTMTLSIKSTQSATCGAAVSWTEDI